jgi:hypothetical protein
MKEMLEKLKALIKSLESEKRESFLICALFLTDGTIEKWDFILSAPWLDSKKLDSYRFISSELQKTLSETELLLLARIVILDPEDTVVKYLLGLETIKNGGYREFSGEELTDRFKFTIKRAYLLRSQGTSK